MREPLECRAKCFSFPGPLPAAMAAGSIVITYLLYRNFAAEVRQDHHK